MIKRLYLILTLLLPVLAFSQSVSIGDILCADGTTVKPSEYPASGKTAEGIVFYVDNTDAHGWAVALKNQSSSIQWSSFYLYGYDIPGLPNYEDARAAMHDLNGYANTGIIRNEGSSADFPAAWSVDYNNGWYLPSAGQLRYLFSIIPEINASLQTVGGSILPYVGTYYWWSSTEFTGFHAYDMNTGGSIGDYVKDNNVNYPPCGIATRQIKDFTIASPTHPTYHVGDLITNEDGSRGILFYVNSDQTDGWMVALNDASSGTTWGEGDIPELTNQTCAFPYGDLLDETDGFANTASIRNHQTATNTAANVVDYDNGWYLPTAGQLSKLFGALPFIEEKLQTYGSTLDRTEYWSSSEANSDEAFALEFCPTANVRAGQFVRREKSTVLPVRAVRNINLNAPIITIIESEFSVESCESYTWNEVTYDSTGQYQQTFTSTQGCDSIVTLHLTINETLNTTFSAESCEPYIWNGFTYDSTGQYQQTFTSTQGCDSIVTLNLTVNALYQVSPIYGDTLIPNQQTGHYTYYIDPIPGAFGYHWTLNGPWEVTFSPDSPECVVNITSQDSYTLTVRIYTECGYIEKSILIQHAAGPDIKVFPNPTQDDFQIALHNMKGETIIVIMNYLGQIIDRFIVDANPYGTIVPYSLKGKAAGVYMVTIINHYQWITKRISKETPADYGTYHYW